MDIINGYLEKIYLVGLLKKVIEIDWRVFFVMKKFSGEPNDIDSWIPVIGAAFSVPFIVFSLAGGYLSDRY